MRSILVKSLMISPVLLGSVMVSPMLAETRVTGIDELAETTELDQVTSVSQLSDVKPTDWAFQALQSLVERYGCIAGYPDKTYRGSRAMTRYEFAAGLNACMDRVNELIAAGTADLAKKEDLETLKKLQDEFAAELATLRGRVDALEARTATLEKQQFSTTTKLNGEVIMALTGIAAGDDAERNRANRNTVFSDRVRLNLDTSFTGKDLLRTRLQTGNTVSLSDRTLTREGDLRFTADNGNSVAIDALLYQFPLSDKTTVVIEANAGAIDDFTNTLNPYFDGDGGSGALTHFATRNAIYYLTNGTGIGIRHEFSDNLELSLGYLANDAANPGADSGLFKGPYGAIAQATFKASDKLAVGLTYLHSYNTDFSANGSTGSNRANFRDALGAIDVPSKANAFGVGASFKVNPQIVVNGSVGYTRVDSPTFSGSGDIWNWMAGVAFPDLGKKGNVAGVAVGMEPKLTRARGALGGLLGGKDRNTSLHIEAFYQYQVTDNIAVTPGVIWLTAPNHDNRNNDLVIGTIRTTFTF